MREVAARNDRHLVTHARIALAATAAVVTMLTGCSAAGGGDEDVTLTYQIWDAPQEEATQAMIDAFEADHPGVDIQLSVVPWAEYWTKLQTTATSGSAPDIFWMNTPSLPKYAAGGVLLPLDDLDGFDASAFAPAAVSSATFDGTLYGVPKDIDALALWYNKAIFAAAGVDEPTNDWTWDDMVQAAQKLTAGEVYGIPALSGDQLSYYNTIPQSGGYVISEDGTTSGYDDPKTIAGIQAWVDLIHEYKVSPTLQQMTDNDPTQLFQSGKLAMTYAGSWMIPVFTGDANLAPELGVVMMPLLDQRGGVSNSVANVGFSGT
jgi:multiple sugar transport system substrate-binding protein